MNSPSQQNGPTLDELQLAAQSYLNEHSPIKNVTTMADTPEYDMEARTWKCAVYLGKDQEHPVGEIILQSDGSVTSLTLAN